MSYRCALLSHTAISEKILACTRGEVANSLKVKQLLMKAGHRVSILDILDLFGGLNAFYLPMGKINTDLASGGNSIIEDSLYLQMGKKIQKKVQAKNPDILFLFSWAHSIAAFFALDLHYKWPVVTKLYLHGKSQPILVPLYHPSSLLVTESLLASEQAIKAGIPPWKLLFLPHYFPGKMGILRNQRRYLEERAHNEGKVFLHHQRIVIGIFSRIVQHKHVHFGIEAVQRLIAEGYQVSLFFKGIPSLEGGEKNREYRETLVRNLEALQQEDWFLWDQTISPYSKMKELYGSIDLFLHLSGSEAGSNVVAEALSYGIPTFVLDTTTNPVLFKGGAIFVESERLPGASYETPKTEDLYQKLKRLVEDPKERDEASKQALAFAKKRFAREHAAPRIDLMMRAAQAYFHKKESSSSIQKEVEAQFAQDCKEFL